ncbi:hypothetical protein KA183_10085 [bacterium]|jgi:hypothetical protein|nr:hypothetical protein [bacterium]
MANIGKRKKQPPKVVSDQSTSAAKEAENAPAGKKLTSNVNVSKVNKKTTGSQRGR